jgi:serine/threonine protein kinase
MSRPLEDDAVAWNVGRYTLYGEIASGGMATVHIGRMAGAAGFAKLVAIKRMHPQFAKDEDFLAMFLDEARLATRIRHPNVVPILDVIAEGGEVLLVMEYVHGDALSRIQRVLRAGNERIPLRIALAIGAAALHGLHAAHEAKNERGEPLGIVHRDVSPQNILVGTDGVARVIDFGIAKAVDQVHMTREGELKGKLVYMAPEQLLGEPVTRQTDIFSMSIVLWEMLTGQRMFDTTDSSSPLGARGRQAAIEPPSSVVHDLAPAIDDIVMKGLALGPEARWETARAMAVALEDAGAPATPAQVGAWVEKVAAKALAERQARIDEIELRGADSSLSSRQLAKDLKELGSNRLFTGDLISARSQAKRVVPPPVPSRPPSADVSQPNETRVETGRRLKQGLETATPSGPIPVPAARVTMPSRPTPTPLSGDPFAVPASAPLDMRPAGPLSLEAPAIPTQLAKPAPTTVVKIGGKSRTGAIVAILVILFGLGFLFWLPSLVKKNYSAAAAAHGFTLVVDDVDLLSHFGSVDLLGATISSSEVPGVVLHAKTVHIGLDGHFDPSEIAAKDLDVNVDASFSALETSLTRFNTAHPGGMLPSSVSGVSIESAHVLWTQALGPGTQAEARGVVLTVTRTGDRSLGDDFVLTPASVSLSTPLGAMGPWLVDAQKSASGLRARVSLDEKAPQNAGLDITVKEGRTSIDLRAMHASPSELSIKPDALNAKDGDSVRVDATLHATVDKGLLDATLDIHADGWRPAGGGPASTLAVSGTAKGDAPRPVDITDAHLSLGGAVVPMTGTVALADDGVLIKGAGTAPLKCDGGTPNAPFALVIDTRDIGKWALGLGRGCGKGK